MSRYVALLRGINVGGKNLIRMSDLRACFEAQGFQRVVTYIQSGNVLFESSSRGGARLTRRIEEALAAAFDYPARIVLRSREQLRSIVEGAPDGFGTSPQTHRYDVLFLKEPLTAPAAMEHVELKPGVDEVHPGEGVLYFTRVVSRASQSRLTKLVSLPIYRDMTIRNWNTTTRLLRMMDGREG